MLGFIPMNQRATVYKTADTLDVWGQPDYLPSFTDKCQIVCNTDLYDISGNDGENTKMSAVILFKGKKDIKAGDYAEFTVHGLTVDRYKITDVSYLEDYGGNLIGTKVVIGNGKRS